MVEHCLNKKRLRHKQKKLDKFFDILIRNVPHKQLAYLLSVDAIQGDTLCCINTELDFPGGCNNCVIPTICTCLKKYPKGFHAEFDSVQGRVLLANTFKKYLSELPPESLLEILL